MKLKSMLELMAEGRPCPVRSAQGKLFEIIKLAEEAGVLSVTNVHGDVAVFRVVTSEHGNVNIEVQEPFVA